MNNLSGQVALVVGLHIVSANAATAQSFTCSFGKNPACLDYGDTVCSSQGMCVDRYAVCFDQFQCDYNGFVCKSDLVEVADEYDRLLIKHNDLVDDFNKLLQTSHELSSEIDELNTRLAEERKRAESLEALEQCVLLADTLDEFEDCQ